MKERNESQILTIKTSQKNELFDITKVLKLATRGSGIEDGTLLVFVPHTTAGITINEAADPDVRADILLALDRMCPDLKEFSHSEGNSQAHVKASLMGSSVSLIIEGGSLVLGKWQGVHFCEFDGPRSRQVHMKFLPDESSF